jgi:prevent-host-death family protein
MPDKQIRSDEARRNFSPLLDEVKHQDVHITVLRYDKPVAVIVPVEWYERARKKLGNEKHS